MAFDVDALADRRRLKRRLAFWRLAAFAAAALAVVVALGRADRLPGARHVAVLSVEGVILGDPRRERAVRDLAEDDSAAALIVAIDSPGGGTFASEALYRAVRAVGETRPVVAVMQGVAASGGYMAALAADRILARESTVTGSIGVMLEATDFAGLMEKLGVASEPVRSGPLKAEPSPFRPMSPGARAAVRRLVDDVHRMFVGLVAERRALPPAEAARLADGRAYTGAMAVEEGLVDALGGLEEAVAWLEEEAGVAPGLPLREVAVAEPLGPVARLFAALVGKSLLAERLTLDGLVSLWQPPASLAP